MSLDTLFQRILLTEQQLTGQTQKFKDGMIFLPETYYLHELTVATRLQLDVEMTEIFLFEHKINSLIPQSQREMHTLSPFIGRLTSFSGVLCRLLISNLRFSQSSHHQMQ